MTNDPSNTPSDEEKLGENVIPFKKVVEQKTQAQIEEEEAAKPRRSFEELPPAAQRALLEAEERRKERDALKESANRPKELGGRGGLDPSRYEDYEIGGRTIDF